MKEALQQACASIAEAERVIILTGAGVSAESGVPTFRGDDGLWKSYRPEELATPQAFAADPRLVWEWYEMRRRKVAACRPNPGHEAIARRCAGDEGTRLITQNVDGLHQLALDELEGSTDGAEPLELHGSLYRVRCTACSYGRAHRDPIDASRMDTLPRCPECDSLLRPGVVWFGEALDGAVLHEAFTLAEAADVCVVVGTSAVVHPAASIPLATREAGGVIVEVNPEPTPLSGVATVTLASGSGIVLPKLFTRAI
jgi:NAD-dependent protein deacetylase/lipoamidase